MQDSAAPTPPAPESPQPHAPRSGLFALALGAVGVVFGDIGTSPLYTMKEAFGPAHGLALTHDNVLGILSLVFWSLMLFVTIKYVTFIMRADNRGEAASWPCSPSWWDHASRLTRALVVDDARDVRRRAVLRRQHDHAAISVLSAVEGLSVATSVFDPYIVPITVAVIIVLFIVQFKAPASWVPCSARSPRAGSWCWRSSACPRSCTTRTC